MCGTHPITPEPRRFSITIPWLILILLGTIGIAVVGTRLAGRHNLISDVLFIGVILVGSTLGITVVWSTGCRGLFKSIMGGATGCAVAFGGFGFFGTLLVPPEPGTLYKFGQGFYGAIAGLIGGLLGGGFCGSFVGLLFGLAWVLRKRSNGTNFVVLAMLYPEQSSSPDVPRVEHMDDTAQSQKKG